MRKERVTQGCVDMDEPELVRLTRFQLNTNTALYFQNVLAQLFHLLNMQNGGLFI